MKTWATKRTLAMITAILVFMYECLAAGESFKVIRTSVAPRIDGIIEATWNQGLIADQFKQIMPAIWKDASMKTEVFVLYDSTNMYIAAKLHQAGKSLRTNPGRRDDKSIEQGDYVKFIIDPLNNGNSAFFYAFSPNNIVCDGVLNALGEWGFSWDGFFFSATTVSDSGWNVELQIPLSNLPFQHKQSQDWPFMVVRNYAEGQELSALQIVDENQPFRIVNFPKLQGLQGLHKQENFLFVPYTYLSNQSDFVANSSFNDSKIGGEITYSPNPSTAVYLTARPDYAQLESDKEIINVSDVPTAYPEKRPFFTASSDLYPGLAVNTRNITDIKFGLKVKSVFDRAKFDVTNVWDSDNRWWLLGDGRLTDNETYYVDLIGGLKKTATRSDYNVTVNLQTWFLDKRLTAYTWFGTINSSHRRGNEFESVNSVKWITRKVNAGLWNHFKSEYYNPNIVGFDALSNEVILCSWLGYSFIEETGFWRTVTPEIQADYYTLYSNRREGFVELTMKATLLVHPSDALGNWGIIAAFRPGLPSKFRYRNTLSYPTEEIHQDAYGPFILVDHAKKSISLTLSTDLSRQVGGSIAFDNKPVRGSNAQKIQAESFWKPTGNCEIVYSLERIQVAGSLYQPSYNEMIHRARLAFNVTARMMFRGIVQLNSKDIPVQDYSMTSPKVNLTFSWEYEPGGFIYLVYNRYDALERLASRTNTDGAVLTQSVALKITKAFSL
jgi:hypothetical protein